MTPWRFDVLAELAHCRRLPTSSSTTSTQQQQQQQQSQSTTTLFGVQTTTSGVADVAHAFVGTVRGVVGDDGIAHCRFRF